MLNLPRLAIAKCYSTTENFSAKGQSIEESEWPPPGSRSLPGSGKDLP